MGRRRDRPVSPPRSPPVGRRGHARARHGQQGAQNLRAPAGLQRRGGRAVVLERQLADRAQAQGALEQPAAARLQPRGYERRVERGGDQVGQGIGELGTLAGEIELGERFDGLLGQYGDRKSVV